MNRWLAGAMTLCLPACGGGGSSGNPTQANETSVAFSLAASTSTLPISAGQSASLTVVVASQNGFAGAVSLSPQPGDLHGGSTVSFVPVTVNLTAGTQASSTMTLTFPASFTNAVRYPLRLSGSSGTASAVVTVTVVANNAS